MARRVATTLIGMSSPPRPGRKNSRVGEQGSLLEQGDCYLIGAATPPRGAVKGVPNLGSRLAWSPDGKGLYCGSRSGQAGTVLYVDLEGKAQALWEFKAGGGAGSVWGIPSPDGHYLVMSTQPTNNSVWMLEGF